MHDAQAEMRIKYRIACVKQIDLKTIQPDSACREEISWHNGCVLANSHHIIHVEVAQ
jgi:hypothetical protein